MAAADAYTGTTLIGAQSRNTSYETLHAQFSGLERLRKTELHFAYNTLDVKNKILTLYDFEFHVTFVIEFCMIYF